MKLASEKSFNRGICPVMNIKGKIVQYPFYFADKNIKFACGKGLLGPKHMMIMDILGTCLIHFLYDNKSFADRIPTSQEKQVRVKSSDHMSYALIKFFTEHLSPIDQGIIPEGWYSDDGKLYDIDKTNTRIKRAMTIKLNDGFLKKDLPFLKKYSSLQISEMIKQTSECIINMNFPIRHYNIKAYNTFPFNNYGIPSRLFTLVEMKAAKLSSDDHVLEREYTVRFDTILGYVFMQNIASCHIDLLPGKYYELSDYAQLFYRMFVLPYFGDVKNHLSIEEVRHRLVLKTKDTYMVRKTIRRILDELAADNFISEPREELKYGKYLYSYKRNTWKEITSEELVPSETEL
jgi:hypothetical protein